MEKVVNDDTKRVVDISYKAWELHFALSVSSTEMGFSRFLSDTPSIHSQASPTMYSMISTASRWLIQRVDRPWAGHMRRSNFKGVPRS